jgi:hypothetical protein
MAFERNPATSSGLRLSCSKEDHGLAFAAEAGVAAAILQPKTAQQAAVSLGL